MLVRQINVRGADGAWPDRACLVSRDRGFGLTSQTREAEGMEQTH